jgi:hypothetical protein
MSNDIYQKSFLEFLKTQHASENLQFYQAASHIENAPYPISEKELSARVQDIYSGSPSLIRRLHPTRGKETGEPAQSGPYRG